MFRVAKTTKGLYFTQYNFFKVDGEYIEFDDRKLAEEFAKINNGEVIHVT